MALVLVALVVACGGDPDELGGTTGTQAPDPSSSSVQPIVTPGTTTTSRAIPTTTMGDPEPISGYLIIGGDWVSPEGETWGIAVVALGPEGARWLGDMPASLGHIESDLAGGIVFQPGWVANDWSVYRIHAGASMPETIVDLSEGEVRWADFKVVEHLGSPAVLYTADTVLTGGMDSCDETVDQDDGDCGHFFGDVNRVIRLHPLNGSDDIAVTDEVIHLDGKPGRNIEAVDYATGFFELRIADEECSWIEFQDENGQPSELLPPPALHDTVCGGAPRMTHGGALSRSGTLIVRDEIRSDGWWDLVVRDLSDGKVLHRIPTVDPNLSHDGGGLYSTGHWYDGSTTIAVLYGYSELPLRRRYATSNYLVLTQMAPTGDTTVIRYNLPPEVQERLGAVEGGCCRVLFTESLDINQDLWASG